MLTSATKAMFTLNITPVTAVNAAWGNQWYSSSSRSSVFYFCTVKINKTQQHMISNTNGRRKGKKRQNDQRCDVLARVKLEDEGISRHGGNTRLN